MAPEITNTEVNFIWNGIKIVTSVVINFERTPVVTNEYGRNAQAPSSSSHLLECLFNGSTAEWRDGYVQKRIAKMKTTWPLLDSHRALAY